VDFFFHLELSSQLQQHVKENLIGRFPAEAFARTSIQFGGEGREVAVIKGFYLQEFDSMEHFKQELIVYLEYYNNQRIKAKLKGLPPAIHRQQALSAA